MAGGTADAYVVTSVGSLVRKQGASMLGTFANMFIAIVGLGVLGMPTAIKDGGAYIAIPMLCGAGFSSWYACVCMDEATSYSGAYGHSQDQLAQAMFGKGFMIFAIILGYWDVAFTSQVYMIVILNFPLQIWYPTVSCPVEIYYVKQYISFFTVWLFIPVTILKNAASLAPVALLAFFLNLIAYGLFFFDFIFLFDAERFEAEQLPQVVERPYWWPGTFFEAYGIASSRLLFAYAAALLVPNFKAGMRDPSEFWKSNLLVHVFTTSLYLAVMLIGFWRCGTLCSSIVTTQVESRLILYITSLFIGFNILLSFPMFANPMLTFVERVTGIEDLNPSMEFAVRSVFRLVYILIAFGLTYMVPFFEPLSGLSASFTTAIMYYMVPPLYHFKALQLNGIKVPPVRVALNIALFLWGGSVIGLGIWQNGLWLLDELAMLREPCENPVVYPDLFPLTNKAIST